MSVVKPMYINPIPYVFQEIRNVKTNSIFGYEALLRPENGMSARDYINSRMMMGGTHQLEVDTFFNAIKTFYELKIPGHLVINSFPNECLNVYEAKVLANEYGKEFMSRIIIDVLEYPFPMRDAWFEKERMMLRYDMINALNSFGDGIFRDFSCLQDFHPDMVTIPKELIHDFLDDPQRKMYLKNLIAALKEQDLIVLAMGIENVLEYITLAEFGIDLAQGYYVGMPKKIDPPEFIPDDNDIEPEE